MAFLPISDWHVFVSYVRYTEPCRSIRSLCNYNYDPLVRILFFANFHDYTQLEDKLNLSFKILHFFTLETATVLKVFSQGNLRRRSLQGPRSARTGDTLTHAQRSVLSLILFVTAMSFTKLNYDFCLIYSSNQMENIKVNTSDHGTWSKHLTPH